MELLYVEWEDASSADSPGWTYIAGATPAEVRVFKQVGFVFDADPWCIVLTEAYDRHQMGPRTRIPMGMIRRAVYLDPGPTLPEQTLD